MTKGTARGGGGASGAVAAGAGVKGVAKWIF